MGKPNYNPKLRGKPIAVAAYTPLQVVLLPPLLKLKN